jgi:hypothetical protein
MINILPSDPSEELETESEVLGPDDSVGTFHIDPEYESRQNSLTMIAGGTEMLRVSPDGFYVRGVKVPADDREVSSVYNAFKQFLVWAEMNRR